MQSVLLVRDRSERGVRGLEAAWRLAAEGVECFSIVYLSRWVGVRYSPFLVHGEDPELLLEREVQLQACEAARGFPPQISLELRSDRRHPRAALRHCLQRRSYDLLIWGVRRKPVLPLRIQPPVIFP